MRMGYFLLAQRLKLGVKMVEFLNAVSCSEYPMAQCIFYPLTVYYHLKSTYVFRVYTISKSTLIFPRVLG
jgi:hypothetical protein